MKVNEELVRQLEWMNSNLNAIVANQAVIYQEIKNIQEKLQIQESKKE